MKNAELFIRGIKSYINVNKEGKQWQAPIQPKTYEINYRLNI